MLSNANFRYNGIGIGFCTRQFSLKGIIGRKKNSIGIWSKGELWIDGKMIAEYENTNEEWFKKGDIIGIGIAQFPANRSLKFFATCKRKLLGEIKIILIKLL
jgi:hypothetical protein